MRDGKGKATVILLSSDGDEDDDEEEEDADDDEEEEDNGDDSDDDYVEEQEEENDDDEESDDDDDDDYDGETEDEEDELCISSSQDQIGDEADHESIGDDSEVMPEDKANCSRVIRLLKEGSDLNVLKLEECKAHLRKHGLRLTGTKAICIERIQEYWRLKDGNAEKLYPRSSFVINCTGDVCKGDIVLFTQKIYKKFDVVKKGGNSIGKRTIAGRVVKESYGAAKQQHTFTVEILWTKGLKKLPPLFPLLVKGRNLYRLRTFRQCWNDERERMKVLAEKHKRGAAARHIRAMKKENSANAGLKSKRHSHRTSAPPKGQKKKAAEPSHGNGLSSGKAKVMRNSEARVSESTASKRKRCSGTTRMPNKRQKNQSFKHTTKVQKHNIDNYGKGLPSVGEAKTEQVTEPRTLKALAGPLQDIHLHGNGFPTLPPIIRISPLDNNYHMQTQSCLRNIPPAYVSSRGLHTHPSFNYEVGSTSTASHAFANEQAAAQTFYHKPFSERNHFSHPYLNSRSQFVPSSLQHLRRRVEHDRQFPSMPLGVQSHMHKSGPLPCSLPGCKDFGAKGCVSCFCWKCCKRTGKKCQRHKLP